MGLSEPFVPPAPPPQSPQPARDPVSQQAVRVPVAEPLAAAPAPAVPARSRTALGAAAEDFAAGVDGLPAAPGPLERIVSTVASGPLAAFEPLRPVHVAAQDIRGIELVALDQGDIAPNRFSIASRSESATVEELQRTLRSSEFSDQLNRLRGDVQEQLQLQKSVTISVAGVSLGLSLVYVLWLIRGGVLMGSYLSALPAWRVLDPLPVLSRVDEETQEDDDALDAVPNRDPSPLRGFG